MNLRSTSPAVSRKVPMKLKDLMRENDLNLRKDNTILPNNIVEPALPGQIQPGNILKQALTLNAPIYPPSHIQQQSLVSIPEYQGTNKSSQSKRSMPSRRHKIFQNSSSSKNNRQKPPTIYPVRNTYSFGNSPISQNPSSPQYLSPNNSMNQANQTMYQTVKSMKSKVDMNRSNTINEQSFSNMEPSGISLKSKKLPSDQHFPAYDLSRSSDQIPRIRHTSSNNASGTSPGGYKSQNLLLNSEQSSNPLIALNRSTLPTPPLPVYENQFYMTKNSINQRQEQSPNSNVNQPFYSNGNSRNPNPIPNYYLVDTLLKDFQQYANQPNPTSSKFYNFNQQIPSSNSKFIQPHLEQSFGPAPKNTYGPLHQNQAGLSQPIITSLSPFEQNQRQQLRGIPRRLDNIQQKVQQHSIRINEINQRIHDFKLKDGQAQRNLLGQLIHKEEELSQKQRQIANNLQRVALIQQQNSIKKYQILKYELQLEQARRVQELSKQNQRLYHQLIRKQTCTNQITRDMIPPQKHQPKFSKQPQPQSILHFPPLNKIQTIQLIDRSIREVSPFTINPDHY